MNDQGPVYWAADNHGQVYLDGRLRFRHRLMRWLRRRVLRRDHPTRTTMIP